MKLLQYTAPVKKIIGWSSAITINSITSRTHYSKSRFVIRLNASRADTWIVMCRDFALVRDAKSHVFTNAWRYLIIGVHATNYAAKIRRELQMRKLLSFCTDFQSFLSIFWGYRIEIKGCEVNVYAE